MDKMMNPSEYLEKLFNFKLTCLIENLINQESSVLTFPVGYVVLNEDEKASKLYFIIQGIVRGYYIDDKGNDITNCFSIENDFFSTEPFRTNNVSTFTVECLEECKCIQLSYDLIHKLMDEDTQIKDFASKHYLNTVGKLEIRVKNLMLMGAEERYDYFCREYTDLQERIALRYIASYIGIRAASLSRIRNKLKNLDNN